MIRVVTENSNYLIDYDRGTIRRELTKRERDHELLLHGLRRDYEELDLLRMKPLRLGEPMVMVVQLPENPSNVVTVRVSTKVIEIEEQLA